MQQLWWCPLQAHQDFEDGGVLLVELVAKLHDARDDALRQRGRVPALLEALVHRRLGAQEVAAPGWPVRDLPGLQQRARVRIVMGAAVCSLSQTV